jgi:hypothetical protein
MRNSLANGKKIGKEHFVPKLPFVRLFFSCGYSMQWLKGLGPKMKGVGPGWRSLLFTFVWIIGCAHQGDEGKKMPVSPNSTILDEANRAGLWFHAKKVRPIWAKKLTQDQKVKTLEGEEQVQAGDYLCRGEAGDIWPQSAKNVEQKYQPASEPDADGWTKYVPRPDNQGVWAAPISHAFSLQTSWGKLTGKPGDFLVKKFQDQFEPYPEDVWIVDQKLFQATYQKVEQNP